MQQQLGERNARSCAEAFGGCDGGCLCRKRKEREQHLDGLTTRIGKRVGMQGLPAANPRLFAFMQAPLTFE
eukprot:6703674-Prymnesium_polylepis.1